MTSNPHCYYLSPEFLETQSRIAIAVSGGPDSLALTHILTQLTNEHLFNLSIHTLTVNHNLREEAASEADKVKVICEDLSPKIEHFTLTWESPVKTRVQEAAREARYELMATHCRAHNIPHLYLGHHQDDQIETFLFRLSKGSGLDGLSCMREVKDYNSDLKIVRPLLDKTKLELSTYCEQNALPFITDPTNKNTDYARPRLRKARNILEQEGLTNDRLSTTIERLSRAKDALKTLSDQTYQQVVCVGNSGDKNVGNFLHLNLNTLFLSPDEIGVRILQKAILSFPQSQKNYAPRFSRIESLFYDLKTEDIFRKRTFAKLIFECLKEKDICILKISIEK